MADAFIILPDDTANTGKKLDTSSLTVAANTVHRERMNVGDPTTDVALAKVLNAAPTTEYGLVVRTAGVNLTRQYDGTNTETTLFDADSGGGSQFLQGVSLRKTASGGSVEAGTSSDPLRTDPTGTTTQPVSATNLDIRDLTAADVVTANLSATDNAVLDNIDADTSAIQTAVELIDDTVATLGTTTYAEATTKGLTIGAVRRDADTTFVNTTNEIGPLQLDANGRLKVEAFSGETLPVSLASTTITGTVAVTQSGTWDEVGINDSGNSITTDWAGVAPPIGAGVEATALRVTVATDSTGVLSVDDNGGSLTVDGITRTEYTVDVAAPAAPVGTSVAAERDDQLSALSEIEADWTNLRASSKGALWVTIPDTNGDPITSFGGGTQYTEDAAAAADPVGTAVNLIRKDTPAAITSTDGDNIAQRGTNYGAAYVQVVSSGGALIDTFGGSGGTAQADESAFTEGTTVMTPVGGVLNDTITSDPTEDQAAAVRITAKRAFHTNLRTSGGTEITAGGGVEAAALRVTVASDSTGVLSVDDNGANLSVDWNGTSPPIGAGVEATALRVTLATDSTGLVSVDDNGSSLTVDGNVGILPVTSGGCSIFHLVSAATTNATNVKASAGQVYGWTVFNNRGTPVYLKFHNTAGTPTAGAGIVRTVGVQAGTHVSYSQPGGMAFGTGIGITIVGGIADADTTAVGASDCVVDVEYK